jgi:hypothetical protein
MQYPDVGDSEKPAGKPTPAFGTARHRVAALGAQVA